MRGVGSDLPGIIIPLVEQGVFMSTENGRILSNAHLLRFSDRLRALVWRHLQVTPCSASGGLRVDFALSAVSRIFWHHFKHLRLVDVDRFGVEVRVLALSSCLACRRLWDTLTPVTVHGREIYPALKAERYDALRRQAFLRDDLTSFDVAAQGPAERGARRDGESVGLQRVKRFTDYRIRRPLERY